MSNPTGLPAGLRRECAFESRPGHHLIPIVAEQSI